MQIGYSKSTGQYFGKRADGTVVPLRVGTSKSSGEMFYQDEDGSIKPLPAFGQKKEDASKPQAQPQQAEAPRSTASEPQTLAQPRYELVDPSLDGDIPDISGAVNFVSDMASNVVPSGKRALEGLGQVIMHPIDTAEAIGKVGFGAAQKLPFVPGTQFVPYADAAGQMLADRYGSPEAIANTVRTDPIGSLLDVATLATGAGAAVNGAGKVAQIGNAARAAEALGSAGRVLTKTGQLADPLTPLSYLAKPVTVPVKAAAKETAKYFSPEKIYERAAKLPPRSVSKKERDKAINAAVEERIPISEKGLEKTNRLIGEIGDQMDAILNDPKYANARIDPLEVAMNADDFVRPIFENQADNIADLAAIDAVLNNFYKTHKTPLTIAEANRLKQGTRQALNKRAYDQRQGPGVETEKAIAHALKKAVDDIAPEVKSLNQRQGGLLALAGELPQAVNRTGNHNWWSALGTGGAGAGAGYLAGGPIGAGLGAVAGSVLRRPAVQSQIAFAADAIRRGAANTAALRDAIARAESATRYGAVYPGVNYGGLLSRFEAE